MRLFGDQMKVFDDYIRFSRRLKSVVGPLAVDLLNAGHSVVLDLTEEDFVHVSSFFQAPEETEGLHVRIYVSPVKPNPRLRVACRRSRLTSNVRRH